MSDGCCWAAASSLFVEDFDKTVSFRASVTIICSHVAPHAPAPPREKRSNNTGFVLALPRLRYTHTYWSTRPPPHRATRAVLRTGGGAGAGLSVFSIGLSRFVSRVFFKAPTCRATTSFSLVYRHTRRGAATSSLYADARPPDMAPQTLSLPLRRIRRERHLREHATHAKPNRNPMHTRPCPRELSRRAHRETQ